MHIGSSGGITVWNCYCLAIVDGTHHPVFVVNYVV